MITFDLPDIYDIKINDIKKIKEHMRISDAKQYILEQIDFYEDTNNKQIYLKYLYFLNKIIECIKNKNYNKIDIIKNDFIKFKNSIHTNSKINVLNDLLETIFNLIKEYKNKDIDFDSFLNKIEIPTINTNIYDSFKYDYVLDHIYNYKYFNLIEKLNYYYSLRIKSKDKKSNHFKSEYDDDILNNYFDLPSRSYLLLKLYNNLVSKKENDYILKLNKDILEYEKYLEGDYNEIKKESIIFINIMRDILLLNLSKPENEIVICPQKEEEVTTSELSNILINDIQPLFKKELLQDENKMIDIDDLPPPPSFLLDNKDQKVNITESILKKQKEALKKTITNDKKDIKNINNDLFKALLKRRTALLGDEDDSISSFDEDNSDWTDDDSIHDPALIDLENTVEALTVFKDNETYRLNNIEELKKNKDDLVNRKEKLIFEFKNKYRSKTDITKNKINNSLRLLKELSMKQNNLTPLQQEIFYKEYYDTLLSLISKYIQYEEKNLNSLSYEELVNIKYEVNKFNFNRGGGKDKKSLSLYYELEFLKVINKLINIDFSFKPKINNNEYTIFINMYIRMMLLYESIKAINNLYGYDFINTYLYCTRFIGNNNDITDKENYLNNVFLKSKTINYNNVNISNDIKGSYSFYFFNEELPGSKEEIDHINILSIDNTLNYEDYIKDINKNLIPYNKYFLLKNLLYHKLVYYKYIDKMINIKYSLNNTYDLIIDNKNYLELIKLKNRCIYLSNKRKAINRLFTIEKKEKKLTDKYIFLKYIYKEYNRVNYVKEIEKQVNELLLNINKDGSSCRII